MNLFVDLLCYGILLLLLVFMTRVRSPRSVRIKVNESILPGHVLQCLHGITSRVGLLNTPALATGDGLLLVGARAVHTMGMTYSIDLIFLDETNRILAAEAAVSPNRRRIKGPRGTHSILELGAGTIARDYQNLPPHSKLELLARGDACD